MKKDWKSPEIEMLDINMTMSQTSQGSVLDQDYNTGTPYDELTWS